MEAAARPTALITGASAGIGAELARLFAKAGHDVILTARRRDRLDALAAELGPHTRVIPADLADPATPAHLFAATGPVDVLVNNAGFGMAGRFLEGNAAALQHMLTVNIFALTALTRLYAPPMVARRSGKILNVASVVAFQPVPGLAAYAATKAYVMSLSEALHAELEGTGVTVTCLCPGATDTEFASVAGLAASPVFRNAMSAAEVAQLGFTATMAGRRVLVTGLLNRIRTRGLRFVSRALVLRIARRVMLR